jgi:hypothetical protein
MSHLEIKFKKKTLDQYFSGTGREETMYRFIFLGWQTKWHPTKKSAFLDAARFTFKCLIWRGFFVNGIKKITLTHILQNYVVNGHMRQLSISLIIKRILRRYIKILKACKEISTVCQLKIFLT